MTDDIVEVMARAIHNAEALDDCGPVKWHELPADESIYPELERAIARAALEALRAAGYVVVPRVPSEMMISRGWYEATKARRKVHSDDIDIAYRAMIEAGESE